MGWGLEIPRLIGNILCSAPKWGRKLYIDKLQSNRKSIFRAIRPMGSGKNKNIYLCSRYFYSTLSIFSLYQFICIWGNLHAKLGVPSFTQKTHISVPLCAWHCAGQTKHYCLSSDSNVTLAVMNAKSAQAQQIYNKSLTNFGWTNKQTEWTHIGKQEKLWKAGWKSKHVWFNQAPLRKLKLMPTWVQGTCRFVCSSQSYTYNLPTTWGNF